jgi:hypothetical protein
MQSESFMQETLMYPSSMIPGLFLRRKLHIAGWFLTGPFLGAYAKDAQDGYVLPAALAAGKTWAVAVPVALALRSLERGYFPATPFIVVSAAATGTLMIGWRTALAAATTPEVRLLLLPPLRASIKSSDKAMFCCLCRTACDRIAAESSLH